MCTSRGVNGYINLLFLRYGVYRMELLYDEKEDQWYREFKRYCIYVKHRKVKHVNE